MPRANLDIHFSKQADLTSACLRMPKVRRIIEIVEEQAQTMSAISPESLASLLGVPARSLSEKALRADGTTCEPRLKPLDRREALQLIRGYLPQIMGWKKVATLASELGIHRNTVASFARRTEDPKLLMYALDKRLYISPKGERVVREQKQLLDSLSHRMTVTECAKTLGVPVNYLTAYAAQKGMTFTLDPLGRTRLTDAQVDELVRWRSRIEDQKRRQDIVIDGERFCSIIKVAEDKAKRISSPSSPEFNHIRMREEGALRHLARVGGVATKTPLGMYIPEEYASTFLSTVTVTQAAAMVGITLSTIKKWKQRNPNLIPEPLAGKRTQGVFLPELIEMAKHKYEYEPKLAKRNVLPAVFVAERIDAMDNLLGISYEQIIEGLTVSSGVKDALIRKRGCIPFATASSLLRRLPDSYAIREGQEAIEDDRRLHRIVSCLGPKTPMIPGDRLIQLVERASEVRTEDCASVYNRMRDFFHLQGVWPKSFNELVEMDKQQRDIPNFPLGCGVYLYLLSDKNRRVYSSGDDGATIIPGDIYLHRELADVGIVESSSQYGPESRAQILFMQQPAGVLFGSA